MGAPPVNSYPLFCAPRIELCRKWDYAAGQGDGQCWDGGFEEPKSTRRSTTPDEKAYLYHKQKGICQKGCGEKYRIGQFHVDHIKPLALGGKDELRNKQLLCMECNVLKGTGTNADLKRKLIQKGIIAKPQRATPKPVAKKKVVKKPTTKQREWWEEFII